ncbi:GPGG-motif small membrane protein [Murinocardiopsis flavida]|nr:GPGG-motif small membrane protein [Murinocardiopsis flavida]
MSALAIILLIVGIILIVAGVMALLRKQMLWGIVLIVVGVIITPGGMIFG